MDDRELVAMAVFRIGEASKRLASLASSAKSPAVALWLRTMAGQLGDQASRAAAIIEASEDDELSPSGT
jgi:hypothetical protein